MRSPTLAASSGLGCIARGPTGSSRRARADRRGFAQRLQQITRGRPQPGSAPVPSADAAAPTPHRPRLARLRVRDRAGPRDPTGAAGATLPRGAGRCAVRSSVRSASPRARRSRRGQRRGIDVSARPGAVVRAACPGRVTLHRRPPAPRAGGQRALRLADGDVPRPGAARRPQGLPRRARRRPRDPRRDRPAAPRRAPRSARRGYVDPLLLLADGARPPRLPPAGPAPRALRRPQFPPTRPAPRPIAPARPPAPGSAADTARPPVAGLSGPRPHRVGAAGRRPAAPPAPADATDRSGGGRGAPLTRSSPGAASPDAPQVCAGRLVTSEAHGRRALLLRHHADLLRQRGPAPRARVHDDRRRRDGPPPPPARRGRVLPDRDRRARRAGRRRRQGAGPRAQGARRPQRRALQGAGAAAGGLERLLHPHLRRRSTCAAVQEVLQRVHDNGYVYEGLYEGWYCPRCADFKVENEIDEGNRCPIHHIELERQQRGELLLRAVAFQERLERALRRAARLRHAARRATTRRCRSSSRGLQDVSLSRAQLTWGVAGAVGPEPRLLRLVRRAAQLLHRARLRARRARTSPSRFWPATYHVIGKDILQVPHRLLAGDADGRRPAAARARLRPRLPARWTARR